MNANDFAATEGKNYGSRTKTTITTTTKRKTRANETHHWYGHTL